MLTRPGRLVVPRSGQPGRFDGALATAGTSELAPRLVTAGGGSGGVAACGGLSRPKSVGGCWRGALVVVLVDHHRDYHVIRTAAEPPTIVKDTRRRLALRRGALVVVRLRLAVARR